MAFELFPDTLEAEQNVKTTYDYVLKFNKYLMTALSQIRLTPNVINTILRLAS